MWMCLFLCRYDFVQDELTTGSHIDESTVRYVSQTMHTFTRYNPSWNSCLLKRWSLRLFSSGYWLIEMFIIMFTIQMIVLHCCSSPLALFVPGTYTAISSKAPPTPRIRWTCCCMHPWPARNKNCLWKSTVENNAHRRKRKRGQQAVAAFVCCRRVVLYVHLWSWMWSWMCSACGLYCCIDYKTEMHAPVVDVACLFVVLLQRR